MPITTSAKKALRVSARKRVFNVRRKSAMLGAIKEVKKVITANSKAEATKLLPAAYKAIDKAAKKGVIKPNTAARKKSRLAASIKKLA